MSYARLSEKQKILGAEVSDLPEAERIDKDEDAGFGKDNKGYGLADELARRQGRLAKIAGRRRRWRPKPPSGPPPRRPSGPAPLARTRTHRRTSRRGSIPGGPETAGATELHRPGVADHDCANDPFAVFGGHRVIIATDLNNCALTARPSPDDGAGPPQHRPGSQAGPR